MPSTSPPVTPIAFPTGLPPTISAVCKATTLSAMPVQVIAATEAWAAASGSQHQRLLHWPLEQLPLSCDALVLTPSELNELLEGGSRMARELQRDLRWLI